MSDLESSDIPPRRLRDLRRAGELFATIISLIALSATVINAWSTYETFSTFQQAQAASLYAQFQDQYNAVASRFPARLLDPDFRPARGTDDYRRLEEYWIFNFSEWFATHRLEQGNYRNLWDDYYGTLALDALDIPSLRYIFLDMETLPLSRRGAFPAYYADIRRLARESGRDLPRRPDSADRAKH